MPFNGIQPEKVTLMFLQLLKIKRKEEEDTVSFLETQKNTLTEDSRISELSVNLTKTRKINYTPGLLLIANPQAGYIFGSIDFAFLAALTYVIGSLCYIVSSILNWSENSYGYSADSIFNLLAALFFIINVIFCFIDWYIQRKQIKTFCKQDAKYNKDGVLIAADGTVVLDDTEISWSSSLKVNMLYFWNNVYFLFAAIVYTFQGIALLNPYIIAYCNTNTFCNNFYMNFFGSLFYVLSGYYSLKEYILTRKIRSKENLPQLPLFNASFWDLDWFGWGNICYMPAGITAFIQSFTSNLGPHNNDDDNAYNFVYLLGNWFFMVNSMQYFIGYMIFVYKMKKALEDNLADVETIRDNKNDNFQETTANAVQSLCNDPLQSNEVLERFSLQDTKALTGISLSNSETKNIERFSTRETVVKSPMTGQTTQNYHNGNSRQIEVNGDIAITTINTTINRI
jgi:hypothetical protein